MNAEPIRLEKSETPLASPARYALSFAIIALFVQGANVTRDYPRVNVLRWSLGRLLVSGGVKLAAQVLSVGVLTLVVAAGAIGSQNPLRNLAPTAIWVAWWVGVAYISALVGNLWAVVNPWSAVFHWIEGHGGADGKGASIMHYPQWLGVWPTIALFAAFAWTELVFLGRAVPSQLALMTVVYSVMTWTGMAVFGRVTWLRHGDPFAIARGAEELLEERSSLRELGGQVPSNLRHGCLGKHQTKETKSGPAKLCGQFAGRRTVFNAKRMCSLDAISRRLITTHMPRNDAAARGHVCPGIRITAQLVWSLDPAADLDRPQLVYDAHLARARWMTCRLSSLLK